MQAQVSLYLRGMYTENTVVNRNVSPGVDTRTIFYQECVSLLNLCIHTIHIIVSLFKAIVLVVLVRMCVALCVDNAVVT